MAGRRRGMEWRLRWLIILKRGGSRLHLVAGEEVRPAVLEDRTEGRPLKTSLRIGRCPDPQVRTQPICRDTVICRA